MPKFTFVCENNHSAQIYVKRITQTVTCEKCGKEAHRQLPSPAPTEVRETIDSLTGVKRKQDQRELLKERKEEYYWKVEVPRLVQKYSLETCLEQGWVWIDDHGKLHVHDKPPHKR